MLVMWKTAAAISAASCVFLIAHLAMAQGVGIQRITADGVAATYDQAVTDALTQAVAQVNGVQVAKSVMSRSTSGQSAEVTQTAGVAHSDVSAEATQVTEGVAVAQTSSGDQGAVAVVGASDTVANASATETNTGTQVTVKDFASDKTISDLSSKTGGVVDRYQVISSIQKDNGWHVQILAEVGVYKPSEESQRQKIIVLPFRLTQANQVYHSFENDLRKTIIDRLTQSEKLAVLDRDFNDEQNSELDFLKNGDVKNDDVARLGNKLGADYMIVGTIDDASVTRQSAYIESVGKTIEGPPVSHAKVSYRVIEVATGQIAIADDWSAPNGAAGTLDDLAQVAAGQVASKLIDQLFPIRIEHVADGVFYLGQGGDSIKVGDTYRVIQMGGQITDSYTHEVIGREEHDVGEISIFEVEPKLAMARAVGSVALSDPSAATNLVARLATPTATATPTAAKTKVTAKRKASSTAPNPSNSAASLLDQNQGNY